MSICIARLCEHKYSLKCCSTNIHSSLCLFRWPPSRVLLSISFLTSLLIPAPGGRLIPWWGHHTPYFSLFLQHTPFHISLFPAPLPLSLNAPWVNPKTAIFSSKQMRMPNLFSFSCINLPDQSSYTADARDGICASPSPRPPNLLTAITRWWLREMCLPKTLLHYSLPQHISQSCKIRKKLHLQLLHFSRWPFNSPPAISSTKCKMFQILYFINQFDIQDISNIRIKRILTRFQSWDLVWICTHFIFADEAARAHILITLIRLFKPW